MATILRKKFLAQVLKSTLFSLVLPSFFIFGFSMPGNAVESSASDSAFHVAMVDKMTDLPVQWVTAGGGVLAYGAGQEVDFALVKEPFSSVSHLSFGGTISGALIIGKYAYLAEQGLGLRIIDLETPSNPIDLGFYPVSGSTFSLANWGNLMFIGGAIGGVQIFEISYGQQDVMGQLQVALIDRGTVPVTESITALAADQGKLYVATTGKGIKVYNVSDPSLILETENLPVRLPVRSMAINGNTLFVVAGAEGLHVFDLSVPGKVETVATYPVPSEAVYPAGRLVYLAVGNDGLELLDVGPTAAATFNVDIGPAGSLTFSPDPVNVKAGDTVNWTWMNGPHSTTSGTNCRFNGPGPNTWDSRQKSSGTFQFTFDAPGSFPYFSSVYCPYMVGTVNVVSFGAVINISVTPAIDFGNVTVKEFSDQTITITNEATSNATLAGSVGTLSAPFSIPSGGGPFSLTPGQSMTVTVRYSPTVTGPASANLSIVHNATNQTSPATVGLSGTGVTTGPVINISVTPATVDFGDVDVGQFADQTITITNEASSAGTLTGSVNTVGPPLSPPFSVQSGGGPFSLGPGQSMTVTVRFSPTTEAGYSNFPLWITHNATNHFSPTVVFLGGSSFGARVSIFPTPNFINFGIVNTGQFSDRTVTITNGATATSTAAGSVSASAPFSVQSGGGPFNLAPGQSVMVTVRFSPTAAGSALEYLSVNNTSPFVFTESIPLIGTGVVPANISVNPSSVDFGNVTVGQSASRTIIITNEATYTGALTGNVGTLAAPFSVVSGGGPFNLTPGQSMAVTVQLTPTTAGLASTNLSITHSATNQTSPIKILLGGSGVDPGGPNVAPSSISGPTTGKPGGRIAIQNTVTNQGNQKASNVTVNFFLSTDTTVDTGDTLIGKRTIRTLGPGASSGPVSTMVTIPQTVAPGFYFIGAMVGNSTNLDPYGITICQSLSKPTNLAPFAFEWSDVNGASTYDFQLAKDRGFANILASATGLTSTQWTVPSLPCATVYWRVRAVNPCGPGPWSVTRSLGNQCD